MKILPFALVLGLVVALGTGLVVVLPGGAAATVPPSSGTMVTPAGNSSAGSAGQVSCPAGSSLTWGPISLNCFQTLNLAEISAILMGVGIALYIYWDSDRAELPGDAAEVPVTVEEEIALKRRREQEE